MTVTAKTLDGLYTTFDRLHGIRVGSCAQSSGYLSGIALAKIFVLDERVKHSGAIESPGYDTRKI